MTTRHQLPEGNWVDVRDAKDVTYRQRRPIERPRARIQQAYRDAIVPIDMPASPSPKTRGKKAPEPTTTFSFDDKGLDILDGESEKLVIAAALAAVEAWSLGDPPTTPDDVLISPRS